MKKFFQLKITITFLTLFICQACNPYTTRRVPVENSPYINCKNCKNKRNLQAQKNSSNKYDFVSDEEQKQIKPLSLHNKKHKRKHKKRVKIFERHKKKSSVRYIKPKRRSSSSSYGEVKEQDLNTAGIKKYSTKSGSYIPLSDTPQKKYSPSKQKKMIAEKKATMQNLANKSKQVTNPIPKSTTLEKEKMQTGPTQQGAAQLNNKLQDLQRMVKKSTPTTQPSAQPAKSAQPVPAKQQAPAQPPLSSPTQQAPTSLPELQKPAPQKLAQQQSTASPPKMDHVPLSAYDIKNKPIPLPQ